MDAKVFERVKEEFKRNLREILEGRDPHRVNDYRIFTLGIGPMETA